MRVVLTMSFRADPWRTAISITLLILASGTMVLSSMALRSLINAVVARDIDGVTRAALWLGMIGGAGVLAGWTQFNTMVGMRENVAVYMDERLIELTTGVPGLEHHERPEYLDEMEVLRTQRDQLAGAAEALTHNISMLTQIGGTIGLLAAIDPLLVLLPVFGLPSLAVGAWSEKRRQKVMDETAEDLRISRHLFELATKAGPAKELRIFGLGRPVIARHDAVWRHKDDRMNRVSVITTLATALGWTVFAIGFAGAIGLVAVRVMNRQATLGDLVLALSLAAAVNQQVSGLVGMLTWLTASLKTVGRYLWLIDYAADSRRAVVDAAPVPDQLVDAIELHDVSFRYPGTDADVLTGVDLRIPAGATVAVVGDNGVGKTTLVKLLCRFYEPTTGRITVDDVQLERILASEWRDHLAGTFQDFFKLELMALQSVGVGDLARWEEPVAVGAAIGRAGAEDVVDRLPHGLDSQLGPTWENGVELSFGQWQKLALARGLMRDHPLLLVLDEPTAALDAETEHALFERFAAQSRAVNDDGRITILVSHRFSTVRMADIIVVLDGSRVVEVGSHDDLMARAGTYAELYGIQASAYR
jgi:ATP-binding cassette subfamily B protein